MQACIHANKCLAGRRELSRVCASLHRHGEAVPDVQQQGWWQECTSLLLAQRREFVSCKRALANYAEQRSGAAHAVPDVCSKLAQASRTAAQTFQLRYEIPQAEWDVTLHPSVSASLHSYMVVQQKLHTAASASVQACTGAEQLQQARKCTKVDVCASLHRHQQCITAPTAWDSKRASQVCVG
jgi:hypothetical protein